VSIGTGGRTSNGEQLWVRLDYATMSVRIGLLGCGEHSEIGHAVPLARYAKEHPGAIELVAACDLRRERAELFCQKYGFARAYQQIGQMLAEEKLDVCIAVVPVELISETGIRLLQSNVPCVVEKPLGSTFAEVQRLVETARAAQTPNMVSLNRRFMPLLNRGIDWARSAGSLRYVRATMLRHERTEQDFLRTTAIHALDTVRYVAGDFAGVNIRAIKPTLPYWYAIDVQFENGTLGRVDILPTAGMLEETYELVGEGFRCTVISPFGAQRLLRCYRKNQLVLEETADNNTPEDVIFGFHAEVVELVDAIAHGRRPVPSIEEIFPSVRACFELADQINNDSRLASSGR
jgi:myo-inositol 2-dehydrogenase/D-chiro-inositol 1-dehydrogenase